MNILCYKRATLTLTPLKAKMVWKLYDSISNLLILDCCLENNEPVKYIKKISIVTKKRDKTHMAHLITQNEIKVCDLIVANVEVVHLRST